MGVQAEGGGGCHFAASSSQTSFRYWKYDSTCFSFKIKYFVANFDLRKQKCPVATTTYSHRISSTRRRPAKLVHNVVRVSDWLLVLSNAMLLLQNQVLCGYLRPAKAKASNRYYTYYQRAAGSQHAMSFRSLPDWLLLVLSNAMPLLHNRMRCA